MHKDDNAPDVVNDTSQVGASETNISRSPTPSPSCQNSEYKTLNDIDFSEFEKIETISKIAGGVAHDLNNFLSPIISYAQLAIDDLSEDEVLYYDMEQILEAARYAHGLAKQLLAFCREQKPSYAIINLNKSVKGAKKMLRRLLRENIILDFRFDPNLESIVADMSNIDQILINMTVNAQDAMPTGGRYVIETANVTLDKTFAKCNPGAPIGERVMISFTDNGHGMREEVKKRIFERGFSTKNRGGTGFGLATVQSVVDNIGGYIHVISDEGQGTCFKIFLPPARHPLPQTYTAEKEEVYFGQGEWVLVVDDEIPIRRLTTRILDKYGYHVLEAESGEEALRILLQKKGKIDLLLTDLVMPQMDGLKLQKEVQKTFPNVKTLIMSGYEAEHVKHYYLVKQKQEILLKPFTVSMLTSTVKQVLHD
ncbi:MAG: response regulator [Deltaproteobacteria bacterium]|nr:response regulator [Deltaproteobacteria bacterium]MBN2674125.1 response regulator [Deltaproteobacteria bacterium]